MRVGLVVAGAMVFTGWLLAQQTPIQGCNGAISCNQPKGFSTLTGNGSVLFGVGFRWGPGYEFRVVTPKAAPTLLVRTEVSVKPRYESTGSSSDSPSISNAPMHLKEGSVP